MRDKTKGHSFLNIRMISKLLLILFILLLILFGIFLSYFAYFPFVFLRKFPVEPIYQNKFLMRIEDIAFRAKIISLCYLFLSGIFILCKDKIVKVIECAIIYYRDIKIFSRLKDFFQHEEKSHLLFLGIIFVFAILIRIRYLSHPMRSDEAYTYINYATKSLVIGLSNYALPNNHLLNTFLMHLSINIFGDQLWAVRLPVFVAGIMIIPFSYIVIRLFYDKHAALLTAALVAASAILIEYSTNARGYGILTLIFLALLSLSVFLPETTEPGPWLAFSLLSALGFYTIPTMLYPFGIVMVWLSLTILFQGNANKTHRKKLSVTLLKYSCFSLFIIFVLYSPVFVIRGIQDITANEFVCPLPFLEFVGKIFPSTLLTWERFGSELPFFWGLMLLIGFLLSLVFHKKISRQKIPLVAAIFLWLAPILSLQMVIPYPRVWLFLWVLYLGLASSGLIFIIKYFCKNERRVSIISFAITFFLFLNISFSSSINDVKWDNCRAAESIVLYLKQNISEGDCVLMDDSAYPIFEYYFKIHSLSHSYLDYAGERIENCQGSLDSGWEKFSRLFVVVNLSEQNTLEIVFRNLRIKGMDKIISIEKLNFSDSILYIMKPK